MKKGVIVGVIVLIIIISIGVYYLTRPVIEADDFRIVKLVGIEGGNFVDSVGYYEGTLNFVDVIDNRDYSIFACSKSWDWVKEGNCYKYDITAIKNNVESQRYSMELSGCYVGTLTEVSC